MFNSHVKLFLFPYKQKLKDLFHQIKIYLGLDLLDKTKKKYNLTKKYFNNKKTLAVMMLFYNYMIHVSNLNKACQLHM